jgi:hypothetical protein
LNKLQGQFENFENTSEINPQIYKGPLRLLVYNLDGKILIGKGTSAYSSNCALNKKSR